MSEVAAGPGDDLWAIACPGTSVSGIVHFNPTQNTWIDVSDVDGPVVAVHIAVSSEGTPWVVGAGGEIYEWKGPGP